MTKGKEIFPPEDALVSKSQRRRDALELKSLAADLIKLPPARLSRVPLEDDVREAVEEARAIRSNVARKRQLQYVAKLLRRIDPEEIFLALEEFEGEARQLTGRQHRSEAWRDYLLQQGDLAIGELMKQRRDTDTQALRQLVRNARKENERGKPPASARSLFRLLRDMDEQEPLPPVDAS
jgi:ribosome-associated protein